MTPLDPEVEHILAMSDEEVLATATPEDIGWAKGFKEGFSLGMFAARQAQIVAERLDLSTSPGVSK